MPSIAQPQHTWTQVDYRPDGLLPEQATREVRPATPAFMTRRRHDVLAQTITQDVVPRLVLARAALPHAAAEAVAAEGRDVTALVEILLHRNLPEAVAFVGGIGSRGVSVEGIYLDLLAPTARHLGMLWDEDLCDFVQVTLGLNRLQQILTRLSAPFQDDAHRVSRRPRVLLAPAPGDSHSFGMAMVASFFQRAGWSGWSGVPESTAALLGMVHADNFAVVGFSMSCQARLDALSVAIRSVRRVSMNPDVRVMVGGPLFIEHPEMVAMVGADATATDGRQAVLQAQNLLALIPIRA